MKMRHAKAALWRKIARRSEKIAKTFGSVENNAYLCTHVCRRALLFTRLTVPWISGLVYGLQNRPRRFESARHLAKRKAEEEILQLFLYHSSPSKRLPISAISSSSNHLARRFLAFSTISGSMPVHTFFST